MGQQTAPGGQNAGYMQPQPTNPSTHPANVVVLVMCEAVPGEGEAQGPLAVVGSQRQELVGGACEREERGLGHSTACRVSMVWLEQLEQQHGTCTSAGSLEPPRAVLTARTAGRIAGVARAAQIPEAVAVDGDPAAAIGRGHVRVGGGQTADFRKNLYRRNAKAD